MKHCCIYVFDQPRMLTHFPFFDIGTDKDYFEASTPVSFIESPLGKALLDDSNLKASCYFSGAYLHGLSKQDQEVECIQSLCKKGQLELLSGTNSSSLTCLFSSVLFNEEVDRHKNLLQELFEVTPVGFINALAIYSNDLAPTLSKKGIEYMIAPRIGWFLGSQPDARVLQSKDKKVRLLLVGKSDSDNDLHVSYLDGSSDRHWELATLTAGQAIATDQTYATYSLPNPVGLDPEGRDLTAYFGNALQKQIFKKLSELSPKVQKKGDPGIMEDFLGLSSTQVFAQLQQVMESRYDTYTYLMNCITDIELKIH